MTTPPASDGTGPHKTAPHAWLRPVMAPLRPLFKEVALASLFVNLLALSAPIFVLQVYDRVVYHGGLSTLSGLVIGMVLVVGFDFVLRQTRSRIMQTVSLNIDVLVGRKLFDKVMALPLRTLESRPLSYWQQVFRDLDVVRNTLSGSSAILVFDLPFALLFVAVVFIIAQPVAWVLLIAFIAFACLAWFSAFRVGRSVRQEKQTQQSRDALLAETIMGRTTIKALSLADRLRPLWDAKQAETIGQSLHRGTLNDRFVNIGHMMTVATTVTMTAVGALAIVHQDMTIGGLVAANMLSGRLLSPFNQLVGAWRTYGGFKQSVDRLHHLFEESEDRSDASLSMPRPGGRITLDTVTFRYQAGARPVIDALSLDLAPGNITGILGRNGSGKSTLLKLIMGLYPADSGRVLLDGADIGQFSRRQIADWCGYVPQECVLFEGTLRDNIAQGNPQATDEQILAAAQASGVHQFVIDLPDGYATHVGEAGSLLSGGMRQRMAIARALVGNPPILILDEPSGSLDRQAEDLLRQTLLDLSSTHAIVVVTHSPVLLRGCRTLIVLDHGKIACSGPTGDVLRILNTQAAANRRASPTPATTDTPETSPSQAREG